MQKVRFFRWIIRLALLVVLLSAVMFLGYRYMPAENATLAMAKGQYPLASEYLEVKAQQGNPEAQNALANLHYLGLGVTQNFRLAAELYYDAAKQGLAVAQLNLGNLYKQGLGVPLEPMRAFAWYKMSDSHGSPKAELYLTQLAIEHTITPLQIGIVAKNWSKLDLLVAEGL